MARWTHLFRFVPLDPLLDNCMARASDHSALSTLAALQLSPDELVKDSALARSAVTRRRYFLTVYSGRPGRAAAMPSSDMNGSEALTAASKADAVAGPIPLRPMSSLRDSSTSCNAGASAEACKSLFGCGYNLFL